MITFQLKVGSYQQRQQQIIKIISYIEQLCKRDVLSGRTVTGGIISVANSSWQLSFTVNRQQQFKKQPKNQVSVWIYALYSDEKGDFIKTNHGMYW